jgi:hypothetical protein
VASWLLRAPKHSPALLLFAGIACLLAGLPSSSSLPGHPMSDLYDHAWGYQWFYQQLLNGSLPLVTENTHWPPGGKLWFVDPLGALMALPFVSLPIRAGLVPLLKLFAAQLSAYFLAYRLSLPSPLHSAIAFGASTYALSCIHSGTFEYLSLAPFPLLWLGVAENRPALTALAWLLASLGAFYYGAFAGIFLLLLCLILHPWQIGLKFLLKSCSYAALPIGLLLWLAGRTLLDQAAVIRVESAPGWGYQSLPVTDLLTFLVPRYHFPDNLAVGNAGILHSNYLGMVLLVAGIIGIYRLKYGKLLIAVGLLSLGPALCIARFVPEINHFPLPLPAALLYLPYSPFRFIHHPFRLVVLLQLVLAIGAGAIRWRGLWCLILLEVLLVGPFPVERASALVPEIYTKLQGGIIDFPPEAHLMNRSYTWYQASHHQKIPYGVNVFVPDKLAADRFFQGLMGCLMDVAVRATPREGGEPRWFLPLSRTLSQLDPGLRVPLKNFGFSYVVLHLKAMTPQEAACIGTAFGEAPILESPTQAVYKL